MHSLFTLLALATISTAHIQDSATQHPLSASPHLSIPLLGYGTWNLERHNASEAVAAALKTGYRHIDCAAVYGNEKEVGRGIEEGLKLAGVGRGEVWVTSKLWNDHHAPDMVEKALDQTLADLGLDYLDLYLMHWPVASSPHGNKIDYLDTWHAMAALLPTHKVHHIGISNFSPAQLSSLLHSSPHAPHAHQMELHPYLPQSTWLHHHSLHRIHVTAYSPLGNSNPTYTAPDAASPDSPPPLLRHPVMTAIAARRNCTPAQLVLRWGVGRGTSVIPKSAHARRIEENFAAGTCEVEYEDLVAMEAVGREWEARFNDPSLGWGVELYEGLDGV